MYRNYLKVALRNIFRQGAYSMINIIGLTIGIASFLLIVLYVQYELSFDSSANDPETIYRVVEVQNHQGVGEQHVSFTPAPMKKTMVDNFPEVLDGFRYASWGTFTVKAGDNYFHQDMTAYVDPSYFRMYGVDLLLGDTATALSELHSVVLSEEAAVKMFGSAEDAINQLIAIRGEDGYKVTAVMADIPKNSHIRAKMLIPFETAESKNPWMEGWGSNCTSTYIRLKEGTNIPALEQKFADYIEEHFGEGESNNSFTLYLQAFNDIHLKSGHIKFDMNFSRGSYNNVLIFSAIALLVLVIACINYINLSIARSVKRAREVGMRKVLGASRSNLAGQFLGESLLLSLAALIIALMLVELFVPLFNDMLGTYINISYSSNALFLAVMPFIWLVVSLVSGSYPAFYLSAYQPAQVLKSGVAKNSSKGWLSKGLVIFQFSVSIVLIITILVVQSQMAYVRDRDPGFNYENVAGVPLHDFNSDQDLKQIADEARNSSDILDYSFAAGFNGASGNQSTLTINDSANSTIMMRIGSVDERYFNMMEIPVLKGRNFSSQSSWDRYNSVIINQAAADFLGWKNPIGKQFVNYRSDSIPYMTVIGVVGDYNYYSMHNRIEPAAFLMIPDHYTDLLVRYHPQNQPKVKSYLEGAWERLFPGHPMNYMLIDDLVENMYITEINSLKLFQYFTLLSILISCMGLFGLTSLITEQRTKEVGIRKALGGSTSMITLLLVRNFMRLVLIAGVVAIPFGWMISKGFLDHFAYKINLGFQYFIFGLLIALLIAFLTVITKVLSVANSNPVDALRYE